MKWLRLKIWSGLFFCFFCVQRIHPGEAERNYYESQLIILDSLEQVLNSVSSLEHYQQNWQIANK